MHWVDLKSLNAERTFMKSQKDLKGSVELSSQINQNPKLSGTQIVIE